MYRSETGGENSQTYPALARVPGGLFGICVAGISGSIYRAGDTGHEFTIMSVAKPFVFALVCEVLGDEEARQKLGVNATGFPFDSVAAVERSADGRSNPMVNAGAIAAVSLVPGGSSAAKWLFLRERLSAFAGRDLALSDEVYASASAANHRNRAIANFLASRGRIYSDPAEALDLYTRQSCLLTSAEDLAVMSATLADGGVNPVTGLRVVTPAVCQHALAVMATAGMYETSGDWLFDVGVPGKSGIGGGMVAVSPGKGGLGTSPPSSTGRGTASGASSRHGTCPERSGSACSRPGNSALPRQPRTGPVRDALTGTAGRCSPRRCRSSRSGRGPARCSRTRRRCRSARRSRPARSAAR